MLDQHATVPDPFLATLIRMAGAGWTLRADPQYPPHSLRSTCIRPSVVHNCIHENRICRFEESALQMDVDRRHMNSKGRRRGRNQAQHTKKRPTSIKRSGFELRLIVYINKRSCLAWNGSTSCREQHVAAWRISTARPQDITAVRKAQIEVTTSNQIRDGPTS